MTMQWFKFYSEFKNDPKIKRMPVPHRYAFVVLLCLANEGEEEERGTIWLEDEDIAFELEMEEEDWLVLKAKFKAKGFIDFEYGCVTICNWDKRQTDNKRKHPSDSAEATRERKRKQRLREAEEQQMPSCHEHVTRCHEHVTSVTTCHDTDKTRRDKELDQIRRERIPDARAQESIASNLKPTQKPVIKSAAKKTIEPLHQNPELAIEVKAEFSSAPKAQDQDLSVAQFSDEIINESDQGLASVAIVPASHGISLMEARLRAGDVERPWERDSIARRAFIEYIANYQKRPGEMLERSRMIAVRIVQKAGSTVPGQDEFDRVAGYWGLFKENAARSVVAEQVTGANKLPSNLVQFFAERDVKIAREHAERQQRESAHAV
jgi:hypothetical protein